MECWASILILTFSTTKMAQLSALHAGCTLPSRKFLGTNFCYRLSEPLRYWMRTEGIGHLKISKDPTRHRTWNLPPHYAVPQLHCSSSPVMRNYVISFIHPPRTAHYLHLMAEEMTGRHPRQTLPVSDTGSYC
jgi:hypothetical protein